MLSKNEAKLWIQEIDDVIKTFPQCVISCLIVNYLQDNSSFETFLTPTCTHGYNHKDFNINDFVKVEPTQITVSQYSEEWIYIPLQQKIRDKFKICLYVSGVHGCKLRFIKNSTNNNYKTFIGSTATVDTCDCYDISPIGKCLLCINEMADKDKMTLIYYDNKTQEPIKKVSRYYQTGTFRLCNTLLVGVGYFPQSVTILPLPTQKEMAKSVPFGSCVCSICNSLWPIYNAIICGTCS